MEHDNRDYPVAYAPIPKGIIKDELVEEPNLQDIQEESGEHDSEPLMAYRPLPHGVIKQELQLEDDGHAMQSSSGIQVENKDQNGTITDQENIGHREYSVTNPSIVKSVVKEEPISDGDDGDSGCELVAYPSLPHGVIKEEQDAVDGGDEFISGVQIGQQEGNENRISETTADAPVIEPLAETAGNENDAGEPETNKRKRTGKGYRYSGTISSSGRVLRSRPKGSNSLKNLDDKVEQLEAEEMSMVECDAEYYELSDHSSLDGAISTDEEDLVPKPKRSARKLSLETSHSHHKEKLPFKCKKCGQPFELEIYLKMHLARTCGKTPKFSCKECGSLFTRKSNLQRHLMKTHNVEQSQLAAFGAGPMIRPVFPFKCHKCEKTYKRKKSLDKHLKFECDLDPSFTCTLCNYRSKQKGGLRYHLMAVHKVDRSQFTTFGNAAPESRPVQPFKCGKCGRTYKHKLTLTQHLKYECGVDPSFVCNQCDFRASRKGTLKVHIINVHAGAGPSQLLTKKL